MSFGARRVPYPAAAIVLETAAPTAMMLPEHAAGPPTVPRAGPELPADVMKMIPRRRTASLICAMSLPDAGQGVGSP